MRNIVFLLAIFICSTSIAQPKPEELVGLIKSGKIYFNRKEVTSHWRVEPVTTILKSPEHTNEGANKTHTYDRYGIVLFEKMTQKKPSDTLAEIQFYFSLAGSGKTSPFQAYSGKFKIETVELSANTRPGDVLNNLSGYKKTDSYMAHNYRLAKDGIYIYFQFSESEENLVKISIGKDTRTY